MLYLQDGGYPALGASGVWKSLIYALAKNAILWRFCLRRARITGPHNAPRYGERRNRHTRLRGGRTGCPCRVRRMTTRHARLRIRLSPLYGINDKDGRYLKIPTVFINGGDKLCYIYRTAVTPSWERPACRKA